MTHLIIVYITVILHMTIFVSLDVYVFHASTPHKNSNHAPLSAFLGYPTYHRGFRCFDLSSLKIIISRHVIFYETILLYGLVTPTDSPSYEFLIDFDVSPNLHHILQPSSPPTSPHEDEAPYPSPPPP